MSQPVKRVAKRVPQADVLPAPVAHLVEGEVHLPMFLYRFLFSNGDVVDIVAYRDDPDVRELVRKRRNLGNEDMIMGVSRVRHVGFTKMVATLSE